MNKYQNQLKHLKQLFALDLGTTKFALASIQQIPDSNAPVIEIMSVPADGMRRGMVSNIEQAKGALLKLIELSEQKFSTDITRVVVGIAGSHLQGKTSSASDVISGSGVHQTDITNLIQKVELQYDTPDRELLHTVPIGYRIDSRDLVNDPIGFHGRKISGDFFLIDADKQYMKDVVSLCNACGLQVLRLYSEPFASASVTVPDTHKELGVALADIGGGTTDGIVFKQGRPTAAFTVNVAGKLMTSDLAMGFNIPIESAEQIKLRFGIKPRFGDECDIQNLRNDILTITGDDVVSILLPRVHELGLMLAKQLSIHRGTLGAGLLLTGGGAALQGMSEYFEHHMSIPVSLVKPLLSARSPVDLNALQRSPYSTKFATVIGLLNLELCRLDDLEKNRKLSWTNRYIGQFINWIKELS